MHFVRSKEGAQQGDPIGPLYFVAPLQVVLEQIQERHPGEIVFAYLDDVFLLGAIGGGGSICDLMLKKVDELCDILLAINELGHAQAQGLLLRFWAHPRLGYWLRGGSAAGVMARVVDVEAESDLPYVPFLQQVAMQKVTEAVGEVEAARGAAFLRGIPCGPALELSSFEYRVVLRHGLHTERPLLGRGGNWYAFIHCTIQRALIDVAKSAFPLASTLHDDFASHLTYSPNHCPGVKVLDAEGLGQHVLLDVATARPMADAHFGAAMMAPGAAAGKVEEGKLRSTETSAVNRTSWSLSDGRRYMEEDAGEEKEVNEEEEEEEDTAHAGSMGWKGRWIRQLSFALARGVAGTFIRRAQGQFQRGADWRWAGVRCRGEADDPGLIQERAESVEGEDVLALMDREWDEVIDEMGFRCHTICRARGHDCGRADGQPLGEWGFSSVGFGACRAGGCRDGKQGPEVECRSSWRQGKVNAVEGLGKTREQAGGPVVARLLGVGRLPGAGKVGGVMVSIIRQVWQ
eukprot:gene34055-biopygen7363